MIVLRHPVGHLAEDARAVELASNEFVTRLAEEAQAAGGGVDPWWGERRAAELLDRIVSPDGYARLKLPDEPALDLLLELDRATEDHQRLREKGRRYAKALARSDLAEPLVLLLVPSLGRAERAADTLAASPAPIAVAVWTAEQGRSPLALIRDSSAAPPIRRPAGGPPRKEPDAPPNTPRPARS